MKLTPYELMELQTEWAERARVRESAAHQAEINRLNSLISGMKVVVATLTDERDRAREAYAAERDAAVGNFEAAGWASPTLLKDACCDAVDSMLPDNALKLRMRFSEAFRAAGWATPAAAQSLRARIAELERVPCDKVPF